MKQISQLIALGCVLLVVLLSSSVASTHTRTSSVGIDAGLFLPQSNWKEHPYAPGVDQFKSGVALEFGLEVKLASWSGLAFNIGYLKLSTSDWEEFAASQGDDIKASAYITYLGPVFIPYLWSDKYNVLKLRFGLNLFISDGEETFSNSSYHYDFLAERIGLILGTEYDRFISERIALALKLSVVYVPSGVIYADGIKHNIIGLPVTIGVRFYF